MSAGKRAIWHNKHHPLATYVDSRFDMNPDVVCDTRSMPFEKNSYDLIVFDPPHMNCGPTSDMSKRYGHFTTEQIRSIISGSAKEAHRVGKRSALMAFKWNSHDQSLTKVLDLMSAYWEPLFGHMTKNGPHSQTYWVMLKRKPKANYAIQKKE